MKLFCKSEQFTLYHGSMLDIAEVIDDNSIDSIVTDPPYELNFMNKGWDNTGIAFQKDTWGKCYQVLKPGGYLLAFGGSRTYHRIACAIEDAGFEIRDTIMWLYGSGFPKSLNIGTAIDKKNGVESKVIAKGKSGSTSKAFNLTEAQEKAGTGVLAGEYEIKQAQNKWNGWGTALKPSFEPIIVARKPFKGSLDMKLVIDLDDFRKNRFYTILKAYIKENPGCNVNEIAYATGFSYCMCRNRINDMEMAGIVKIKRLDDENPHSWVEGITLNESNGRN